MIRRMLFLGLLFWAVSTLGPKYLYGPASLGFSSDNPAQAIQPVRRSVTDAHDWVQDKLARVQGVLEEAHRFVQDLEVRGSELLRRLRGTEGASASDKS